MHMHIVYGKMLQNARNYTSAKFFYNAPPALRFANNPLFKSFRVLAENLVVGFGKQKTLTMDKPFIVGWSVLELSKYFMYSIWYNQIKRLIPKARMLATDTDSFIMCVPGKEPESILKKLSHIMDFSNVPTSHELYSPLRKQNIGFLRTS
jgi:hypothetical protein